MADDDKTVGNLHWADILVIVAYFATVLGVGLWVSSGNCWRLWVVEGELMILVFIPKQSRQRQRLFPRKSQHALASGWRLSLRQ